FCKNTPTEIFLGGLKATAKACLIIRPSNLATFLGLKTMVELSEQTVNSFFHAFYSHGILEVTRLVLTNTQGFNNGLRCASIDDAMKAVRTYREHALGCCIALRKASVEEPGKRGKAEECAFLPAFFVDVDYAGDGHRKNGLPSREHLEAVL